jgi:hypothetical protein
MRERLTKPVVSRDSLRAGILKALQDIGIQFAGTHNEPNRWPLASVATDLSKYIMAILRPLLVNEGQLEEGIYRLYWKEGGYSLAAVGFDKVGKVWYAPTNWVDHIPCYDWDKIEQVELIETKWRELIETKWSN